MRIFDRSIALPDETRVTSRWAVPDSYPGGSLRSALLLAHGAGIDMHNPFLSFVHARVSQRGLLTVKFNFPYKELGRKAPDPMPRLEATWRVVVDALRQDPELAPNRLFLGGKSMGGRVASHLAAQGLACDGLVFLGYPLHPAGKPERLRAEHLARVACPMLFVQGTRDPLCDLSLLESVLSSLGGRATLRRIEGGDHSFKVLKRQGRAEQAVWAEVVEVVAAWLALD
jgi:predicted alpha/beta-hydrolase family hydrolase